VEERTDMFTWMLRRALAQFAVDTPEGKKALAADLLPLISAVPDQVVAGEYVQQLAAAMRIEPRYVADDLHRWKHRRIDKKRAPEPAVLSVSSGRAGDVRQEERLLTLLVADPSLFPKVVLLVPDTIFEAPHTRDVYRAFRSWYDRRRVAAESSAGMEGDSWRDLRALLPEDDQKFLDILLLAIDVERERGEWDPAREALGLVREILLGRLRRDLRLRAEQLRTAVAADRGPLLREVASVVENIARTEHLQWL